MIKRITAMLLAIAIIFICFGSTVFAASEATASVPVVLTIDNTYRVINVTVPAVLPINITNGVLVTATNARIKNNSDVCSVKVSAVTVNDGDYEVGSYNNFSNEKKTFALKINGIPTEKAGRMDITEKSFPDIEPDGTLNLKYYAKVSGDANGTNKEIGSVIFTIDVAE